MCILMVLQSYSCKHNHHNHHNHAHSPLITSPITHTHIHTLTHTHHTPMLPLDLHPQTHPQHTHGRARPRGVLQRRPFSARPGSAGKLQHTSYRLPTSMATALLSPPARGLRLRVPAAPYPPARFTPPCARCLPAPAHSARRRPRVRSSRPPSVLYRPAPPRARCPAGHFARNQLPGRSMGLSPLHPARGIDLHVRLPRSLGRGFPRRRSRRA